ncbi:hypothetical protein EJ06DRAFT_235608 [Trichodelitschia bisporula]|uniref:MARVEL domain-containing protein n=1 Tax=Trichodelitschia bisporula TaxID=703511 RepID=A0A6G1HJV3_9PEZI|nr:hypothetical protein EJ06DRAFT_235608 [Trichodelitschia bisporula]
MNRSLGQRSANEYFRAVSVALAVLSTVVAAAVMGTTAHVFNVYRMQHEKNPWWLPYIPGALNSSGTKVLIGTGAAVVFLNLIFVVASLAPKINIAARSTLHATLAAAVALISAMLAAAAVAYVVMLNKRLDHQETLETWTCRFQTDVAGPNLPNLSNTYSNREFDRLCKESRFGFGAMVAVLCFQTFFLLSAVGQWVTRWSEPTRRTKESDSFSI